MANIDLIITADDSQLIARLAEVEKRLGNLDTLAHQSGKAQQAAFGNAANASEKMNASLKQSGSLMGQLGSIAASVGVAAVIAGLGKEIFDATKKMQSLEASFTNAFSDEGANAALVAKGYIEEIRDIAAKTPFEFDQLTESILKLKNRGFEPTRDEIIKLGDLASTTGKDFGQLSEALLDAQTGEFERLKEFGIRATKANGEVTLSFKGQTTVVKDNEEAIKNAIVKFGELKGVQGSMAAQAATLGGQLSNLSDSIFQVASKIGEQLAPAMQGGVQGLSDFIGSLDVDKIFLFFKPISEKLIPALENLYNSLVETAKAFTGSATEGELMDKVMQGLSFAFELVVDALTTIIDGISFFSNALREAYKEGGIFTAVVDGISAAINGLGSAIKYILEGLQKLYLGEEEFNKRQQAAVQADIERANAAIERKKRDEESAKALEEHRNKQDTHTKSTVANKDAVKDAEKALKNYTDALKNADKIIEDFNKKTAKAKIDNLQGEAKLEAQKKADLAELTELVANEDKKLEIQQSKQKVGSTKYEELQKRRNVLVEAGKVQEQQIEIKYANDLLDLKEKVRKEELDGLKKQLDEQAKLLSDAQKEKQKDFDGNVSFIQQQSDLQSAEYDLQIQAIEAKGNLGDKELAKIAELNALKLESQIAYLEQVKQLKIAEFGEDSVEVKLIENQIQGVRNSLSKLKNDKQTTDILKQWKHKLATMLGLTDEELDDVIGSVVQGVQAISSIISQANQDRIDENQALIDSLKDRIDETADALKKEEELKAKGYANNVEAKQAELLALEEQEKKAQEKQLKLKKEALKRQLAADLAQQASATAVAAVNFFAAYSPIPIVGIALALGAIASMAATVAKYRSDAKALDKTAYKGGSLSDYLLTGERDSGFVKLGGDSDTPGRGGRGYKVQGTNLRIGGNEFLMNERTSLLHGDFLQKMNSGLFDGTSMEDFFKSKPLPNVTVIAQRTSSLQEESIKKQQQREMNIYEKVHRENATRIVDAINKKAERVSTPTGYIEWKGDNKTIVHTS